MDVRASKISGTRPPPIALRMDAVHLDAGCLSGVHPPCRIRQGVLGNANLLRDRDDLGIPIGVSIIVFAFLLTGIYVWVANSRFDEMNRELIKEVTK